MKRTTIQIARDKARDSIWSYVVKGLSGQAVKSRGPTGKAISQPLTEDNQIRLLQTAWRKLEPDLNATAVSADIRSEHVKREPAEPRELARSVLSILEHARLADESPIAEPFEDNRPAPHQLLLGRDSVIEIQATANSDAGTSSQALSTGGGVGVTGSASSPSSLSNTSLATSGGVSDGEGGSDTPSPSSDKPQHGDRVEIPSNGGHIFYHGDRKLWAKIDNLNHAHGWDAIQSEALAKATKFPRYSGPWQPHPFKPALQPNSGNEPRRDNLGRLPRTTLNIVRSRPR